MSHENTSSKASFVRLELTSEQQMQVRASIGIEASAIELSAQELEERIAPAIRVTMSDLLVSG